MHDPPTQKVIVQNTIPKLEEAFDKLQNILESIGFSHDTQAIYFQQAQKNIEVLLEDMVTEIQEKKQDLLKNIEKMYKQMVKLREELHMGEVHETYDDIPLIKVEQLLCTILQDLEQKKNERFMVLKDLLAKEQDICKKLGAESFSIKTDVVPTKQELESFELYLREQENKMSRLQNIFADMRCSIIKIMDDLDTAPFTSFERLVYNSPDDFVLSASNMAKLKELRDQLEARLEETKCHVEKIKLELLGLWKYLDEPAEICQLFLDRYPGYDATAIEALTAEIKRCREKRKENIEQYVMQMRSEVRDLWDMCRYSQAERDSFVAFNSSTFTEDLLMLHELEVAKLRNFYSDNRTIFELLDERDNLLNKAKELLQRANNPGRYHNRGGQLLMEEKERKVIQKKLPKIDAQLRQLISEYESSRDLVFTIYGTSLEHVLAEAMENVNVEKETIRMARKEARDKSVKKSPLNSSRKTPGMSHLSIHRGPALSRSKRKLFTPSPNTSAKRRNKNSDKSKVIVIVPKVRWSGRTPKSAVQKNRRISKGEHRKNSSSVNNSLTDTTYNQFQGHMTGREELHSSLLPEQLLRNNIVKTPVRTPAKPLRKNLPIVSTPIRPRTPARNIPLSPRIVNTPKLTVKSDFPIII